MVKRRALLSVSDKRGLPEFARGLVDLGWALLSTGGTARALRDAGLAVTDISQVTGHPEMMDGRVKTLHPAVHAGLLARRDRPSDLDALEGQGYGLIDLVAVNLYPFHEAAARGAPLEEALEQIDIGGPSMLRSAAKNHTAVIVVVDPEDYGRVLDALRGGGVNAELRRVLAARVFSHTSRYDAAISAYLTTEDRAAARSDGTGRFSEDATVENVAAGGAGGAGGAGDAGGAGVAGDAGDAVRGARGTVSGGAAVQADRGQGADASAAGQPAHQTVTIPGRPAPREGPTDNTEHGRWPDTLALDLRRVQALRYGENPDQDAAFYADASPPAGVLPDLQQLHGKELSFNNLLDLDAAVTAAAAWRDAARQACVIIKHTTPCGVALGDTAEQAYERAFAADPVSAFGGIVAFTTTVTEAAAQLMAGTFLEIVVAPAFEDRALETLTRKKNLRLITLPLPAPDGGELDFKRVRGGFLVQSRMRMAFPEGGWRVVTQRPPDAVELEDLRFAWRVAANVKSNAIVLARDARTIGIGAGQMSRVDSSRLAVLKAKDTGAATEDCVLASDAFFPFRDGIDAAAEAGVRAVIQPGGSVRDDEVIAAANEHGMAMIFTGRRVFRH